MAELTMNMYSSELAMDTTLNVLLPEQKHAAPSSVSQGRRVYPVIYVLHGYSDNYSSWMRKSTLEFIARDFDVIVVMPEVNNAFYADRPGARYHRYIASALPERMAEYFPISQRREDTFVMGNSMGGYGAFLLALAHPERYAAAASFSGILGIDYRDDFILLGDEMFRANMDLSFGGADAFRRSPYDLCALAESCAAGDIQPRLLHMCGKDDYLAYAPGKAFIDYVSEKTQLPVCYEEIPGGDHSWRTWNPLIERAFSFFGLERRAGIMR